MHPDQTQPISESDLEAKATEWLVVRCQLGEPEGFEGLVNRWHRPLWHYLLGLCGDADQAEDLLQETWLRILRGIARLRDASRLRPWLFTLARRTFFDRLRNRYAEPHFEEIGEDPEDDSAAEFLDLENRDLLDSLLPLLSRSDRETLSLFYLHELDLQEVSEILEVPVGTVKSRLHRARRFLREQLKTEGDSP